MDDVEKIKGTAYATWLLSENFFICQCFFVPKTDQGKKVARKGCSYMIYYYLDLLRLNNCLNRLVPWVIAHDLLAISIESFGTIRIFLLTEIELLFSVYFRVTGYSKKANMNLPRQNMNMYFLFILPSILFQHSRAATVQNLFSIPSCLSPTHIGMQVLREFNHVNPQDDEEGKEFSNTRVCILEKNLIRYHYT